MIAIAGTIIRIDEPKSKHHKFGKYLLIETNKSGKVGIQVRRENMHKVDMCDEGDFIECDVHFEHSTSIANNGSGKTYYHNNIILDEIKGLKDERSSEKNG